jgi:phytoene synthase
LRDRDLVRLYWPVELRPAFDALFGIDDALAEVVFTSTQPALGAIRLAWWRDALERLDANPPPPEPRLQAVAAELLPRGITGAEVARLEDGWATLLDDEPDEERVMGRGEALFSMAAKLLGGTEPLIDVAGRL